MACTSVEGGVAKQQCLSERPHCLGAQMACNKYQNGFCAGLLGSAPKIVLLWDVSNEGRGNCRAVRCKETTSGCGSAESLPSSVCVANFRSRGWNVVRKAQRLYSTINPAFPQVQVVALTAHKFINTLFFTTFAAGKIEKCREFLTIIKTLLTPQTPSIIPQIPLTTSPPMMSLKYCRGCLH